MTTRSVRSPPLRASTLPSSRIHTHQYVRRADAWQMANEKGAVVGSAGTYPCLPWRLRRALPRRHPTVRGGRRPSGSALLDPFSVPPRPARSNRARRRTDPRLCRREAAAGDSAANEQGCCVPSRGSASGGEKRSNAWAGSPQCVLRYRTFLPGGGGATLPTCTTNVDGWASARHGREDGFMEEPTPRPSVVVAATRPRLLTRALARAHRRLWMVGKEGPHAPLVTDDARRTGTGEAVRAVGQGCHQPAPAEHAGALRWVHEPAHRSKAPFVMERWESEWRGGGVLVSERGGRSRRRPMCTRGLAASGALWKVSLERPNVRPSRAQLGKGARRAPHARGAPSVTSPRAAPPPLLA